MAYAPLSDLPLGRAQCAICVRIARLWDYCGNKEGEPPLHVDMVLVDEKENRIYAEIPGSDVDKFRPLLKDGGVYMFRKFIVSGCKPAYKPIKGNQMIRFTRWTTVDEVPDIDARIPRYVFDLVDFEEFPSRTGQVEYFIDTIGMIVGVSKVAHVHLPSTHTSTAKRTIALKDLRNNQINLVLWGSRATDFDTETVHSIGQNSPVVAIFVGMLPKSYKNENTLSGGSACKWYINEEIPEIEYFFDRAYDNHPKVEWISAGEQQFRALEQQQNFEEKTVLQLKDIDPWDSEGSGYRCTVTISRISDNQQWWFPSCTKCHRAAIAHGTQYKCSGGCPCTTAEPKYRLSLIGTDGTGTAEFVLFGKVARQIVGKPVISLIRSASRNQYEPSGDQSSHILPELAALVSQKFTFSVIITQKSFSHRNVSFQVNGIIALHGKQSYVPKTPVLSTDPNQHNIVPTPVDNSARRQDEQTTPQKKARLAMITIPCKRSLVLEHNKNDGESSQSKPLENDTSKTDPSKETAENASDETTPKHPQLSLAPDVMKNTRNKCPVKNMSSADPSGLEKLSEAATISTVVHNCAAPEPPSINHSG
ncbi:unnamed protein product [Urochloa humidicola]